MAVAMINVIMAPLATRITEHAEEVGAQLHRMHLEVVMVVVVVTIRTTEVAVEDLPMVAVHRRTVVERPHMAATVAMARQPPPPPPPPPHTVGMVDRRMGSRGGALPDGEDMVGAITIEGQGTVGRGGGVVGDSALSWTIAVNYRIVIARDVYQDSALSDRRFPKLTDILKTRPGRIQGL